MSFNSFWMFFKVELSSRLAYRSALFLDMAFDSLKLLVPILTWMAVFKSRSTIGEYTLKTMIGYLIIVNMFTYLFSVSHGFALGNLVKSGKLNSLLVRPFPIIGECFSKFLARVFVNSLLLSLPLILALIILRINPIHKMPSLGILLLFSNLLLAFMIGMSLACLAFWTTETWALVHIFRGMMALAGGVLFPLTLLPEPWSSIFMYSPFSFIGQINVSLLQGQLAYRAVERDIIISLAWALFFSLLYIFVWRRGVRRYEAVGG